jgi:hypothetical protein
MHFRAVSFVALLVCAACGEQPVPAPAPATPSSLAAPAPKSEAERRLESDALAIEAEIEKLRGQEFRAPVELRVSDKQGLLRYIEERRRLDTTPERERFLEQSAKLTGLIRPELDLVQAVTDFYSAQVGGFYDPPSKSFRIMQGYEGDLARLIMAHEFVHALDDQWHDLDRLAKSMGNDSDAMFAFSALCEGSAMTTMTQWMLSNAAKLDPQALAKIQETGMAGMKDLPPFVWKPSLAAYTAGQSFVEKGGKARLAEAFAHPPRSSEQILHPEKYWDAEKRDDPVRVSFVLDPLPAGWKVAGEDTLGEVGIALLAMPIADRKGIDPSDLGAMIGMKFTNAPAAGWDGDRLLMIEKDGVRIVELLVVFDTEPDAAEFHDAMRGLMAAGSALQTGLEHSGRQVRLRWSSQAGGLETVRVEAELR